MYKTVNEELRDTAEPQRIPGRDDVWMCPFCKRKDFFELNQVWNHFDAVGLGKLTARYVNSQWVNTSCLGDKCPGECFGVEVRLENRIFAMIMNQDISSSTEVTDPTERMKIDQVVTGRITSIKFERFGVRLTTRSADLQDEDGLYKIKDDEFTDSDKKVRSLREFEGRQVDGKRKAQYIKVWIGLCKLENEILKEAKNAEKSHF